MLFSDDKIARYINRQFEPAWQTVRKAAVVNIDFGNGKTVTRTLNGNIATYICRPDGVVLDVVPGVYDRDGYLQRLQQGVLLHQYIAGGRRPPRSEDEQAEVLKDFHAEQAKSIRKNKEAKVLLPGRQSITGVEAPTMLVLKSSLRGRPAGRIADRYANQSPDVDPEEPYKLPRELGSRTGRLTPKMLKKDADYNESVRRLKVHQLLAKKSPVKPDAITKTLYKDVLDTNLDDPYLGLGKVLFETYPFETEGER